MSAATNHDHDHAHGHDHGHGHGHGDGAAHGTRRGYVTGFLLSVVLTAIPFWLVMSGIVTDTRVTAGLIMAAAAVQIVVHMIFFLHMNTRSEAGWTFMALMFTIVILVICIAGSVWVMYHMNQNMMPQMRMEMGGGGM